MLSRLISFLSGKNSSDKFSDEDYKLLATLTDKDSLDGKTAYAALLLEVAAIDGNIDPKEEQLITALLQRWFKLKDSDLTSHIKNAKSLLANFRSGSSYTAKITEQYSEKEKAFLLGSLRAIMASDGVSSAEERLLYEKLEKLLS